MKVIILAGGSGTRLWPISRERFPKQFVKFEQDSKKSLFQETFLRSLKLTSINDIYVVTSVNYKHLVVGEVKELGYTFDEENVVTETIGRNTLPAILAPVFKSGLSNNQTFVVFPSDHKIIKNDEFVNIINDSKELANKNIITFGITPNFPNTGYGYIQPGEKNLNGFTVTSFKEKPSIQNAKLYIQNGYYWNAGIFMFNSDILIEECLKFEPDLIDKFKRFPVESVFGLIENGISIDYGILEKSNKVSTVPIEIGWNDLGSFDSFYEVLEKDIHNNIIESSDKVISIESSNNLVYETENKVISTIGLDNFIVVDTRDALLICKKDESQKVKDIVNELNTLHDKRLTYNVEDYRPWGHYKILEEQKDEFKIKRILVDSGKRISYQYHKHRSEHWVIVRGVATITIDGVEKDFKAGQSVFIEAGQKHRLSNNTNQIVEIIEVQLGNYLEEDDIYRLDDDYGRE